MTDTHSADTHSTDDHPLGRRPPDDGRAVAGWLATTFATVTGNTMLVGATIVLGSLATLFGWLPPRGNVVYALGRVWSRLILAASLVRLRSRFEIPLDSRRGYIFMVNHQSMYDIPALMATTPGQGRFMAKRGLFQIPIFGWSLKAGGFIPVDRKDRASGEQTFKAALKCLERGHSLLIFPEETRSRDGALLPFKRGGFLLALKTGFEIVPVGIRGSREARGRGSNVIRPGEIVVHYGAPVDPATFGIRGRRELLATVRERIATLASAPSSEAGSRRHQGGTVAS
jgi:1-acyl-sn-glycerol-3-phosphate acyltransferase